MWLVRYDSACQNKFDRGVLLKIDCVPGFIIYPEVSSNQHLFIAYTEYDQDWMQINGNIFWNDFFTGRDSIVPSVSGRPQQQA